MAVSEKSLIKLGGWPLGIDNLSSEQSLTRSEDGKRVVALRAADNVDIDRAGAPRTRDGYTALASASTCHSLYCADGWTFGLVVLDGALCIVTEDGATQPLLTGLSPWDELTYCALSDRVLWSNGARSGAVDLDGTLLPPGVATPPPPDVSASTAGGLAAGLYQVTMTWQRAGGEEGGAPESTVLQIPAGGGIQVSGIPAPDEPTIARTNIYVTPPNGDVFYRAASVPAGVDAVHVGVHTATKRLDTQFLEPLPPANILRRFNARVLAAVGRTLVWTEAVRPTLANLTRNQMAGFSSDIAMVEPLDQTDGAGVYVAAKGRTFWLAGNDPKEWQLRLVHPYGAVPGSSLLVSGSVLGFDSAAPVAYWLDSGGFFCIGAPGGVVQRVGANRFAAGTTARATSVLRERAGERHILTSMRGRPSSSIAFGDAMETTLIRGGSH